MQTGSIVFEHQVAAMEARHGTYKREAEAAAAGARLIQAGVIRHRLIATVLGDSGSAIRYHTATAQSASLARRDPSR